MRQSQAHLQLTALLGGGILDLPRLVAELVGLLAPDILQRNESANLASLQLVPCKLRTVNYTHQDNEPLMFNYITVH